MMKNWWKVPGKIYKDGNSDYANMEEIEQNEHKVEEEMVPLLPISEIYSECDCIKVW